MKHFPGANFSERLTALPIDGVWRPVFIVELAGCLPGEKVQAFAEFEVTNDTGRPVGVFALMKLCADPSTYAGGFEMGEANGRNVTPDMHHDTHTKAGSLTIPASLTGPVFLVVWARAVQTVTGLPPLTVEQDFGQVFVNVFKPDPYQPGEWL